MDNAYLFENDRKIRKVHGIFCGIDEAGRGCLAGRVYAAAVILPENFYHKNIFDSKKLSEKKREELYDILTKSFPFGVGFADEKEIDEINILNASMLAMKRAFMNLPEKPAFFLADGNKLPDIECEGECVIKGDGNYASVAAASIVAKVTRDRYMYALSEKYPEYAFDKHKGYATKLHYEKIRTYGVLDIHRKTFLKKMH